MNALARTDYAPWSLPEAVVADFVRTGLHLFDHPLDGRRCGALLDQIRAGRRFDDSLFLTEEDLAPTVANAPVGLLERLDSRLNFVERAPQLVEALWSLLGPDYRQVDRQVVCALPERLLPDALRRRARGGPLGDISRFVRPEHRDLVFTSGEAFRQDVAEAYGSAEVVSLRLQLHDASDGAPAVRLLEGSHRMGAAPAPHDLKATAPGAWRYRRGGLGEMYLTERGLAGEAGSLALWHAFTLHAAEAPLDEPQFSLVYRFARGQARSAGLDEVNASLAGPLALD